jgi:hypothetical protein
MKRIIVLGIFFIMFGVFMGCTKENNKEIVNKEVVNQNPQKVIEDYL